GIGAKATLTRRKTRFEKDTSTSVTVTDRISGSCRGAPQRTHVSASLDICPEHSGHTIIDVDMPPERSAIQCLGADNKWREGSLCVSDGVADAHNRCPAVVHPVSPRVGLANNICRCIRI